jgi:hypothetical protein
MVLGDSSAHIELKAVEVQTAVPGCTAGGDVRVVARMRLAAFAGAIETWIKRDAWATFRTQLEALERIRQGEAILESMSPGELRLRIRTLDRLGHMGVEGEFLHYFYGSGARQPQVVRLQWGALEFDPTLLPRLVAELAVVQSAG